MKKYLILVLAAFCCLSFSTIAQTYVAQVKSVETGNWGYVDNLGNMVVPAKYNKCHEFSRDGFAPVYNTKSSNYYFINTKNEVLKTEIKNFKLVSAAYGYDIMGFHDGFVPVGIGKYFGYMNSEGKLSIPAKYNEVLEFNSGRGVGRIKKTYYSISETGEEFPVANASEVRHFSEGLAPFRDIKSGKFGFIGPDGNVVIAALFEGVGYFTGGLAWARIESGKIGYINNQGEWVLKPQFDVVMNFNPESGVARVKMNNEWGYVNKEGESIFNKNTDIWGDFNSGLALGRKNGQFGFFDFSGNWVIKPSYSAAREFKNGFAAVQVGKKWGFIDTTGSWVIKPTFEAAKDMELIE